jgi:hypothetical protein
MAPDRGRGKSTLASVIGQLYGNPIELAVTASAEDRLVSRLLTPEALTRRVVRIDDLKGGYASALRRVQSIGARLIEHHLLTPFITRWLANV